MRGFTHPNKNAPIRERLSWLRERLSCSSLDEMRAAFDQLSSDDQLGVADEARRRFPSPMSRGRSWTPNTRNLRYWLEFTPPEEATDLERAEMSALMDLTDRACHTEKDVRSFLKKPVGHRLEPLLRVAWAAAAFPGPVHNVTVDGTRQKRKEFSTRRGQFLAALTLDVSSDLGSYLRRSDLFEQEMSREWLDDGEIRFLEQMRACLAQLALLSDLSTLESFEEEVSAGSWVPSRPAQWKFRAGLISLFGTTCALSGPTVGTVLEAAHVRPYREVRRCDISNGLLLRADLHQLFDSGELKLVPEDVGLRVVLTSQVAEVPLYAPLRDRLVPTPFNLDHTALDWLAQGRPDGLAS